MRRTTRALVLVMLVATLMVGVAPARAARVPRTLAHAGPVGAGPVEPGFPVDVVGVQWDGDHGEASIRFRHAGRWGVWQVLQEDGVEVPGRFASGLMAGHDADAYQVRVPPGVGRPEAVAINTTDGPLVEAPRGRSAGAATTVVSRAGWGADESLRFDSAGREKWPPTYHPVQKLTVHHTAPASAGDPCGAREDSLARAAVDGAAGGPGSVLGGDRQRPVK